MLERQSHWSLEPEHVCGEAKRKRNQLSYCILLANVVSEQFVFDFVFSLTPSADPLSLPNVMFYGGNMLGSQCGRPEVHLGWVFEEICCFVFFVSTSFIMNK